MKQDCIQEKFIKLPTIGTLKFVQHRSLPAGFKIKTATITKKADGYYVTLSLEDETVPQIKPDVNTAKITGIGMGLIDFLTTAENETVAIP